MTEPRILDTQDKLLDGWARAYVGPDGAHPLRELEHLSGIHSSARRFLSADYAAWIFVGNVPTYREAFPVLVHYVAKGEKLESFTVRKGDENKLQAVDRLGWQMIRNVPIRDLANHVYGIFEAWLEDWVDEHRPQFVDIVQDELDRGPVSAAERAMMDDPKAAERLHKREAWERVLKHRVQELERLERSFKVLKDPRDRDVVARKILEARKGLVK